MLEHHKQKGHNWGPTTLSLEKAVFSGADREPTAKIFGFFVSALCGGDDG